MAIITRAAFAKVAGVNRVQMTKLIASGTLTGRKDAYIDTTSPKNVEYLGKHGVKEKGGEVPLAIQKIITDMGYRQSMKDKADIAIAVSLGRLVPIEDVQRAFLDFGGDLSNRLLNLPRAFAARHGLTREQEDALASEISTAISTPKKKAKRSLLGRVDSREH